MTGASVGLGTTAQQGGNPGALSASGASATDYNVGQGMRTDDAEALGASEHFNEMAFSIEKVTVTAKSRAESRVLLRTRTGSEGNPRSKRRSRTR